MAAVNVTFPGNLAQVKTAADLRSVPSTLLPLGALFLVNGLEGLFEYDPGSLAPDDGKDVLRPADKTPGQVGRWIRNVDGLATGPEGPTGPANSTYTSLAALKAAPQSNRSYILADGTNSPVTYAYVAGDFTGRADDVNVVKLDTVPLTTGALVRQTAESVVARAKGATAVFRPVQDVLRDVVNPKGHGARGDFTRAPSEQQAFMAALAAVRNNDDASFSGKVDIPNGAYQTTGPIQLASSFVHLKGTLGSTIWAATGQHNLRANDASFVLSDISGLRLYGGVDGIRADTLGEIASLVYEDVTVSANTGNGFYFQGGLTSSTMSRLATGGGTKAVWCTTGINNNNVWSDCHFYNASDDVIRIDNMSNANQFRNVHLEGGGVAGKAQFALAAPICNHIIGGWSEGSHEYLVTIVKPQDDPMAAGVIIDGLTSIGSSDLSGGFTGSKFSTGNDRVVLGSNAWLQTTIAPLRVFVYGVNRNMRMQASQVWTRDTPVDKRVVAPVRSITDTASQTFPLFTVNRPNTGGALTNQQAITVKCTLQFTGLDGGGSPKAGVWEVLIFIQGITGSITSVQASVAAPVGPVGGVTLTIQQGALATTQSTVNAVVQGVNSAFPNFLNYSLEVLNVAGVEADGFTISL